MRDTAYTIWFDRLSLPSVFLLTVLFVLLSIVVGAWVGKLGKRSPNHGEEPIGSVVGATLGLLAFILAFTFGMTASRYDARKQLLLEEVNAIGTTYLRAGLLSEPYRSEVRDLLREYVDLRVRLVAEPDTIAQVIARSEQIQSQLWSKVEQMTAGTPPSVLQVLFIQSLNDTIDLQTKRVTVALQYRVPATIWLGLYMVALFAMTAVGYQFAQSGRRQLLAGIILALSFSSVLTLIADLDRAGEGTVRLNQQPLYHLQTQLHAAP
jgi:cellobiose-specific phosphotransferase system component IIC